MRGIVAAVASQPAVQSFFEKGPGRTLAGQFVAGETLSTALDRSVELREAGYGVALDYLGESVRTAREAEAAADVYLQTIRLAVARSIPLSLSIKPSQFGLDLSPDFCARLVERVAAEASRAAIGVRLDMENSRHTDATLAVWRSLRTRGISVGVVLQAALRRSPVDLEEILAAGGSVRLCKGAYTEPAAIAYPRKIDVDRSYERMLARLLHHAAATTVPRPGGLPIAAIATHDARLIDEAIDLAHDLGCAPETYEFQLLYGVRRDLQRMLVDRGYPVRIYVPWGPSWYPYLTRRLAERPANLSFVLKALAKDWLASGRSAGSRPDLARDAVPPTRGGEEPSRLGE